MEPYLYIIRSYIWIERKMVETDNKLAPPNGYLWCEFEKIKKLCLGVYLCIMKLGRFCYELELLVAINIRQILCAFNIPLGNVH